MSADLRSFSHNFALLTGHSPMSWQNRLFDRFIDRVIPTALDLPTGLGKTSVIAIWLIARAHGAKVPRRLVYAVDRRAVVDQASEPSQRGRHVHPHGASTAAHPSAAASGGSLPPVTRSWFHPSSGSPGRVRPCT